MLWDLRTSPEDGGWTVDQLSMARYLMNHDYVMDLRTEFRELPVGKHVEICSVPLSELGGCVPSPTPCPWPLLTWLFLSFYSKPGPGSTTFL